MPAYREHKGGHWRQELRMDHGEDGGQVALPGPHKEQSVDREQAVSLIPEQPRYRLSRTRLPPRGFLVSLIYSGGTGENSEVLLISSVHLDRVRNGPTKESGRTQQLCHLWARRVAGPLFLCYLNIFTAIYYTI